MTEKRSALSIAVVFATFGVGAEAQQPVIIDACRNFADPDDPCVIGQWAGPFDLAISCDSDPGCSGGCDSNANDEIAHAILIPTGPPGGWNDGTSNVPLAGKVLLWTACDNIEKRGTPGPGDFYTYVWDPADPANVNYNLRSPIIPVVQSGIYSDGNDGPFCAGHAWMLDEDKNPKLITVGGAHRGHLPDCDGKPYICGLNTTYWFDPTESSPASAWKEGPGELSSQNPFEGLWYPSVTTYFDGSGFYPIILGGSGRLKELPDPFDVTNSSDVNKVGGCGYYKQLTPPTVTGVRWAYESWWTLAPAGTPATFDGASWTRHDGEDWEIWQTYPRTFQLSLGTMIAVGGAVVCEEPLDDSALVMQASGSYGPPPVSTITVAGTQSRDLGPDPNAQMHEVGAWHYSTAAIMHTLAYKDRVFVMGGTEEFVDDTQTATPFETPALAHVLELQPSPGPSGTWWPKAPPSKHRVFSNAVVLPDRTILHLGGQDNGEPGKGEFHFLPELFDPGDGPQDDGTWRAMAPRVSSPAQIPRTYHSVALLLPNGTVALMGGEDYSINGWGPSQDTAEIFSPPYLFESGRLKIQSMKDTEMRYSGGPEFCINVNRPSDVSYAVLMGVGSVTHAFDYGQRYVELATTTSGCTGYDIKIVPPSNPAEVPEGYYMLFVVEERAGVRIPCVKGRFVKVY